MSSGAGSPMFQSKQKSCERHVHACQSEASVTRSLLLHSDQIHPSRFRERSPLSRCSSPAESLVRNPDGSLDNHLPSLCFRSPSSSSTSKLYGRRRDSSSLSNERRASKSVLAVPPAPVMSVTPMRTPFTLADDTLYNNCAVGVRMSLADRLTVLGQLPVINSRFAHPPVVEPDVRAALAANYCPYSVQDQALLRVQETVVETNGLLALVMQALASGDVTQARAYTEWAMQVNGLTMHELTILRREKVLSTLVGSRDPTSLMPSVRTLPLSGKEKVVHPDQSEAPPLFGRQLIKEVQATSKESPLVKAFSKANHSVP